VPGCPGSARGLSDDPFACACAPALVPS
jgi:hypothetical protein